MDAVEAGVKNHTIDHPSNLEGTPFWMIIEEKDDLVPQAQQWASYLFMKSLHANVELVVKPWKHVFAMDKPEEPLGDCSSLTSTHLCGYDTANKILTHLLFNLHNSNITEDNWKPSIKDYESMGVLKPFS
jgi:hypothetical protein